MKVLHLPLRRGHGGVLCGAFHLIELCLHRPLIHQDKSNVGLVFIDRCHSGIYPDIVINGQIVISVCCLQAVFLAQNTVKESMFERSVIVVELDQKIRIISVVNPLRHFIDGIVCRLSGNRVAKHNPSYRLASKQPDIEFLHRSNPVRHTFIINLKTQFSENIGRVPETEMSVDIPIKIFAGGIFHSFIEHNEFCRLCCHIDPDIGRNSFRLIRKPLDYIRIAKRRYPDRLVLIVDLAVELIHFKLGHHVHHASHLSVSKKGCRLPVQKRNLVKGKFLDICLKIPFLHSQELLILFRVDDR